MYRKQFLLLLAALFLVCSFSACGISDGEEAEVAPTTSSVIDSASETDASADSAPVTETTAEPYRLSDIVPALSAPDVVKVVSGVAFMELGGGQVFAAATQEQADQIITLLESLDMNVFVQNTHQLGSGAGAMFLIEGAEDKQIISVVRTQEGISISLIPYITVEELFAANENDTEIDSTIIVYTGPDDPDWFLEIEDLQVAVLFDVSDLEHCAAIRMLDDSQSEYVAPKGDSSQIEHLLEGTIEYTGSYKGDDAFSFNIEVTIGDDVYSVDTSTGIFSKGDALFKLADERMLQKFMMLVGKGIRANSD